MSKKKKTLVDLGAEDVDSVVSIGNSFYGAGKQIVYQYVKYKKTGKHFEGNKLAVAATNMTLSFELYIKALLLTTTDFYKVGHDLKVLYEALPTPLRLDLKNWFERDQAKTRGDLPIIRRLSPLPVETAEYNPWAQHISLDDFLLVHADGFMEWRYHFQPELDKTIYADFALMFIFHKVLKKGLKKYVINPSSQE